MNIVINTASLLTPLTGIGQYTYQLSKKLKEIDKVNRYTYYYGFFSEELFHRVESSKPFSGQYKIGAYRRLKDFIKKIPVLGTAGRKLRTLYSKTMQKITGRKFDLYFEPNFIPLGEIRSGKIVTMVFDLSVMLYPEWHPKERIEVFRKYFTDGIKNSDAILASTHFIKRQIVENLKIPDSRIFVTPISCNQIFRVMNPEATAGEGAKLKLPENYLLFVGSIEPRKNILSILKAYQALPNKLKDELFLVFCGPAGWKNEAIFKFIEDHDLRSRIVFTNYVSDETLCVLYNKAKALIYPSFYEGFGLPPLEAMASGCPVIVSDIPTHREVCGEAVLYVDPHSPEQLTSAIQTLVGSKELQQELKAKGLARSREFSWDRTAQETLRIFGLISDPTPKKPAANREILEVGCGKKKREGRIGIDWDPESNADVHHNLEKLPWPFPDNQFDRVVCSHILEHLSDPVNTLHEVHRICRPGAHIEIVTPHYSSLDSWNDPSHKYHFGLDAFVPGANLTFDDKHFKMISRELSFARSVLCLPGKIISKISFSIYEKVFSFIFPARNIKIVLEVIK